MGELEESKREVKEKEEVEEESKACAGGRRGEWGRWKATHRDRDPFLSSI